MQLPEELSELFDQSESIVKKYIESQGSFSSFALALQADGEVVSVLASEQFTDSKSALGGILGVLQPWAKTGKITASVICMQFPESVAGEQREAVMFDLENNRQDRIYVVMPFYKHDYLGWCYDTLEFIRGKAQLFAR